MIRYIESCAEIEPRHLAGFFAGWPNPPSPETHLRILQGSDQIVLALDEECGQIVGFITAVSDGVLSAFIPLLEVHPAFQGRDIGQELVERMLRRLDGLYMVDLVCDDELEAFYRPFGMIPTRGMSRRRYDRQSGG